MSYSISAQGENFSCSEQASLVSFEVVLTSLSKGRCSVLSGRGPLDPGIDWRADVQGGRSQSSVKRQHDINSIYSDRQDLVLANSVDPDQTPQKAASDQDLNCLSLIKQIYALTGRKWTGPSCSKHRYLNELVCGQNVNCSSTYNI